jgi:hypothetical protein
MMSTVQVGHKQMWKDVFSGFRFLEGILLISGAVGSLTFWVRTRFWLPKYIHMLAAIGLIVGVLSVWASPADAPIKQHGLIACILLALALPATIYAYFIVHGGQHVAFNRSLSKSSPCPFCRNPLKTLPSADQGAPTTQFAESVCPHCSHTLS